VRVDIECVSNSPGGKSLFGGWLGILLLLPLIVSAGKFLLSVEIYARFCLPCNPHKDSKQGCGMIGKYLYIPKRYKAEVRCSTVPKLGLLLYFIMSYHVLYPCFYFNSVYSEILYHFVRHT
jgi:hypothetical protein